MAVKIIIKREVKEGLEPELMPILFQIRNLAMSQQGYISGETLRNIKNPEEYIVISAWQSYEHWKKWEKNEHRLEIQNIIDVLLGKPTEFSAYQYP